MAYERWDACIARAAARTGTLPDACTQQWEVIFQCMQDLAACEQLHAHDALRTRAHLYRSYNELLKGYTHLRQADRLEGRFDALLTALRAQGVEGLPV